MPLSTAKMLCLVWVCLGLNLQAYASDKLKPLVSVLGTCSTLTSNTYPADSQNWFDASKQSQVVFYAHLLFPTVPELGSLPAIAAEPWHPPLAVTPTVAVAGQLPSFVDEFYAQAEWLDPDNKRVAFYGLTFPARIRSDYVRLEDRWYAPHTFAMAIGTRDLRREAGQTAMPEKIGQYHVRFSVDGQSLGVAFFRMLKGSGPERIPTPNAQFIPLSPTGLPNAISRAAKK